MGVAPKRMTAARTVGLTIGGTVGAAVVLSILYTSLSLWNDVATIKVQQQFYHGPWPPPYQERDKL